MSCAPRVIGVPARLLLLTLVTVALLLEGPPTTASSAPPPRSSPTQRAVATVLPPIAQMGPSPQDPSRASTVVAARFRPAALGRPVALELRRSGTWRLVERSRLDSAGRASFAALPPAGGPATYRVTAAAYRGLPEKSTKPVDSPEWGAPAFIDTFDAATLAPAWEHRIQFYNPWGGRSCSKGDPSAVSVGGGTLKLSVLADPARASESCATYDPAGNHVGDYRWRLNGHVSTQHSFDFQYGVAAARMRFQRKQGQHAAFWLQPRGLLDTGPTPWGAEIDVIEWYGEKRGARSPLATAVHRHVANSPDTTTVGGPLPDPDRYLEGRTDRWWRNYHVFSVEWTPREYVFRIDGQETMRTSQGVSHHPEFLILSMLSSDFELGLLHGEDQLPQHVDVDWVAAWPAS
jgi:beta-glucanase (GH16 family)